MKKEVAFQLEDVVEIPDWVKEYPEHKFTVFKGCFLSTKKNSHELNITKDVLKKCAHTILGSFLVAKVEFGDAKSHEQDEIIYGYAPMNQEIEFVEEEDNVKAYCYFVVSKRYSKEFNDIFEFDNMRNSSVEMTVETPEDDESDVLSFDIYGLTCLNKRINGSCPDADIKMVRFSKEEAEAYFNNTDSLTSLKKFVEERKHKMAEEKTYKVDKSKEALSDKAWGEVDKTALYKAVMEAKNKASLVKDVYMLVEDGWEEAPSEKLKYPVKELKGDTFVYNRDGLASALGYAKKENEASVVSKVEKIYKKLGLDSDGKEEDKKMAEIEKDKKTAEMEDEIEGRKAWAKVIKKVQDHVKGSYVDSVEKDHIIYTKDNVRYRVEADVKTDPDDKTVDAEIKWDTVKKDADQQMSECEPDDDDKHDDDVEMSADEMKAKMAQMAKDIEERDNIIMGKDKELEELRTFKQAVEDKEKAMSVEAIMAEVKDVVDDEAYKTLREEGLACSHDEVDGWANKTKVLFAAAIKKSTPKKSIMDVWSFAAPVSNKNTQSADVWQRLKTKN